jgi:hypothetical protein
VAHSLFFSPRTLYLVCVDLQAFATVYMQAVILADDEIQEPKLLDEFVEDSVMRWVRHIVARQPDAEFVFLATKEESLEDYKANGRTIEAKSHGQVEASQHDCLADEGAEREGRKAL